MSATTGDRQGWKNISLRAKSIFMVCIAALPVIVVTEGIVAINKNSLLRELRQSLLIEGKRFAQEFVWIQLENQTKAESLANLVQATRLDLANPAQVSAQIEEYIEIKNSVETKLPKTFQILTDAQGRTVAQDIQVLAQNPSQPNPALVASTNSKYTNVSLPTGIYLGDIPIVRDALKTGRSLSGMELLKREPLQRLELDRQASISWRSLSTQNSSSSKPQKTYALDGSTGLVCIAVHPIKINNKLVGTAIVGTLLNRNYALVDEFGQNSTVVATVFAQDLQVNTNVTYSDGQRAVGTRADQKVAETVLNQGREFSGKTNILGKQYLTFYSPLYDHQKELNPTRAKPVGMAFVGKPWLAVERSLLKQAVIGYSVAGAILLIAALIATPIQNLYRPFKRLADLGQHRRKDRQKTQVEPTQLEQAVSQTKLADVLPSSLNVITTSIEPDLETVRLQEALSHEVENERLIKERFQQGITKILLEIEGVQRGDLTVRVDVKEDEMNCVADAFNAVIYSLQQIVIQVQTAAKQLHESAFRSEAYVQKQRDEATNQARVVAAALKFVEQISQSIAANTSSAQKAVALTHQALFAAKYGGQAIDQTASSIEVVQASISEISRKTSLLAESQQKISKIVSTISGISEKTNLLAFNASIEAARSGENSQGFRLIAEEVRRLAQQVTNSTGEIEQLVSTIQQETAGVLKTMESSATEVGTSIYWVAKTQQTLQAMAFISQETDQLLQLISASTISQAQCSRTVSQTIQTAVATLETISSESEAILSQEHQMVEVAQKLQNSVSQFQVEK